MTVAISIVAETTKTRESDDALIHRFTRDEYRRMAELGWFDNQRVELLEGRILDMPPRNEPHVTTVSTLNEFLVKQLPDGFQVRCQAPIAAAENSEPEPDFSVVASLKGRRRENPRTALLAIEVSDSTLRRDRGKTAIYAAAGVKEYWIINVRGRTIEQYTEPSPGDDAHYATRKIFKEGAAVQCTVLPLPPLAVTDCLKWT